MIGLAGERERDFTSILDLAEIMPGLGMYQGNNEIIPFLLNFIMPHAAIAAVHQRIYWPGC